MLEAYNKNIEGLNTNDLYGISVLDAIVRSAIESLQVFSRISPIDRFTQQDQFLDSLIVKSPTTSLRDLEDEIAEWHYRRHVPIPFTSWAIRPFWRDGKLTPPLPLAVPSGTKIVRPIYLSKLTNTAAGSLAAQMLAERIIEGHTAEFLHPTGKFTITKADLGDEIPR